MCDSVYHYNYIIILLLLHTIYCNLEIYSKLLVLLFVHETQTQIADRMNGH